MKKLKSLGVLNKRWWSHGNAQYAPVNTDGNDDLLKEKATPAAPVRLSALGPARYIASVHIVCGHLVRRSPSPVPTWVTSDWGYTWVPWFFMLSGFVLTFARLNR
eukprot:Awhi_evm1s939